MANLGSTEIVLMLRRLAALGAVAALIGCAEKVHEQEPDRAPIASSPPPRAAIDYQSVIGVAQLASSSLICIAIPASLRRGEEITLVSVPVALAQTDIGEPGFSSVLATRIGGSATDDCGRDVVGNGLHLPGDSLYSATLSPRDTATSSTYIAVVLPFNTFFRVGHVAGARLSSAGDMLNFRMCASREGLHLTAWEGKPLTGKRVWHRYLYQGNDVEPTCTNGDY